MLRAQSSAEGNQQLWYICHLHVKVFPISTDLLLSHPCNYLYTDKAWSDSGDLNPWALQLDANTYDLFKESCCFFGMYKITLNGLCWMVPTTCNPTFYTQKILVEKHTDKMRHTTFP